MGFLFVLAFLFNAQASSLSIDIFKEILENERPDSVESFLPSPRIPYDYRTYFRALKRSTAIQPSRPHLPRFLCYGPTGEFIFTFNSGLPARADHFFHASEFNQSIDVMQWVPTSKTFDFYHLEFFPGLEPRFHLSEVNPERCIHCHQNRRSMSRDQDLEDIISTDELLNYRKQLNQGEVTVDSRSLLRFLSLDWEHQEPDRLRDLLTHLEEHSPGK